MRNVTNYTLLNAKAATGVDNSAFCADHRHKQITVGTAGMGAGDTIVVKIVGSISETCPTWTSAQSAANMWDYIQIVDLEDGSTVDGDTGITIADSDDVRQFSINVDGLKWLTARVTIISDAVNTSVTVKAVLFND